jgi:hypothetical protein
MSNSMDDNTHVRINAYSHHFIMHQRLFIKSAVTAVMLALLLLVTAGSEEIPFQIFVKQQNNALCSETRVEACLNGEWRFCPIRNQQRLSSTVLMQLPSLPTDGWGTIRVPGKWKQVSGNEAADSFGYPREWTNACRGWYQRTFTVPPAMRGKRIKLHFGAVLVYAEVLVNGKSVGRHLCGVTPFDVDITDVVHLDGQNTLTVYVVNEEAVYTRPPKSRYDFAARAPIYYSYSQGSAGIWQDVMLVGLPSVHVDTVFVKTLFRRQNITAEIELRNEGEQDRSVTVDAIVEDLQGVKVKNLSQRRVNVTAGSKASISLESAWSDAHLWSPEAPNLYRLHARIFINDTLADEYYQRFGFREFWIDGRNFYLNGRRITLFGDWVGLLGCGRDAYVRPEYCRAYVQFLKGLNYMGTRMQAIGTIPAMLDACDELGLPIIATGISDSAAFFDPACADEAMAHAKADMLDWLRRDRNHPCILIWSTENEDAPPLRSKDVVERYHQIDQVFLENDPTRPFLHDGAAQTISRSDADGWAPILCPHYVGPDNSFGQRLREFRDWSEHSSKPLILGEENVGRNEDPGGLLYHLMGDRIYGEIAERDALWSWYIKRIIGAWRTCGIGGIIAHGNHLTVGNSPITATVAAGKEVAGFWGEPVADFHWTDLTSPFAKPKYLLGSNLDFVNPWIPSIPETMPTPLYVATRDAFNPVLVTLSRAVEHNYFSGEKCAKDVFLINEGPVALKNCMLTWEIRKPASEQSVMNGKQLIDLAQGEIRSEKIDLQLPKMTHNGTQQFIVTLMDAAGKFLSRDEMKLTIYPLNSVPDMKGKRVMLYDSPGLHHGTIDVLKGLGVAFESMDDIEEVRILQPGDILVIGAGAANEQVAANETLLKKYLQDGGRILFFEQPTAERRTHSFAFVKAPDHPAFRGLASRYLSLWRTPDNNLALGALRIATTARPIVLADTADKPVLIEYRYGKGILIACMLELTEGCLRGEPEAQILTSNLLSYLAAASTPNTMAVRCLADQTTGRLLAETLRVADMKRWDARQPLPAKANPATMRFLAAVLANLNVPTSDSRCFLFLSGLVGFSTAEQAGAREWRGFFKIDLTPYCNRVFYDDLAGDGLGGWDDSGDNDMRSLPTGDLLFGGLPFHIIDISHDDPYDDLATRLGHPIRACIVLKGVARPSFPSRVEGIKVGQKARKLFFLHTATWSGGTDGQLVGRYVIRYTDGTTVDVPLKQGMHIDDWTRVGRGNLKEASVAWMGSNSEHSQVGLYVMPWQNPYPDREITAIDFESEGAAVPILIAITAQR